MPDDYGARPLGAYPNNDIQIERDPLCKAPFIVLYFRQTSHSGGQFTDDSPKLSDCVFGLKDSRRLF